MQAYSAADTSLEKFVELNTTIRQQQLQNQPTENDITKKEDYNYDGKKKRLKFHHKMTTTPKIIKELQAMSEEEF